ncbi:MAG: hypothetical protein FJ039_05690 [Chloroflexi bacterium]|nr:hypothetical protein [Chloroflexota bacterium]
MSKPFVSKWLNYEPKTTSKATDKTDKSPIVGFGGEQVGRFGDEKATLGQLRSEWQLTHCAACGSEDVAGYDPVGQSVEVRCAMHKRIPQPDMPKGLVFAIVNVEGLDGRVAVYSHISALAEIPRNCVVYSADEFRKLFTKGAATLSTLRLLHEAKRQGARIIG